MNASYKTGKVPHIVIVGGGFGGLYAAKALAKAPIRITLVDRNNVHLFQPLLYQVATGGLSPADIASPLRAVLSRHKNVQVFQSEAIDLDPVQKHLILNDGLLSYDILILATGVRHDYFGNDVWAGRAPGLKTVEEAVVIRNQILSAFENAEMEAHPVIQQDWLRIGIIGGGPTGVELAGALAELARHTLANDFRQIDPTKAEIILVEGQDRILPGYPSELSHPAQIKLEQLGVQVRTETLVTDIAPGEVRLQTESGSETIKTFNILWAAGMKASPFGRILAERTGIELDRAGRVKVAPDLSVPGHPEIFVIGDLAHFSHQDGQPLPGVAPVAIQEGRYVAELIQKRLLGSTNPPFKYRDKGNLAVIGRNAAVADFGFLRLKGLIAWLLWVFIHIAYIIEFDNKLVVLIQWAWNYITRNQGARLITNWDGMPEWYPIQSIPEDSTARLLRKEDRKITIE